MSDNEKQFNDWLDGKTASHRLHDDEWLQRASVVDSIRHQASFEPEHKVPEWDRGEAFSSDHQPWWHWGGMPIISMAFSIVAMALVIFKVELIVRPEGLMLSFAGGHQQQQDAEVSALVDLKLREFAAEQQVLLANYATDFTAKQQDSNLQLATYIISSTRQERKEDMTDFIGFINDQRKDEKLQQKIKFQQIEQAISYSAKKNATNTLEPADLGYQVKPANWTTEE